MKAFYVLALLAVVAGHVLATEDESSEIVCPSEEQEDVGPTFKEKIHSAWEKLMDKLEDKFEGSETMETDCPEEEEETDCPEGEEDTKNTFSEKIEQLKTKLKSYWTEMKEKLVEKLKKMKQENTDNTDTDCPLEEEEETENASNEKLEKLNQVWQETKLKLKSGWNKLKEKLKEELCDDDEEDTGKITVDVSDLVRN